jgi:hypothetical protein
MATEIVPYNPHEEGVVIYRTDDNTLQLEVQVSEDTVWLTQQQMSMLFNTSRNNITLHIGNIFKEHELEQDSVCKESLLTAQDGKTYRTKFYNLDVIISVGYRVKSQAGTRFRQWATKIVRDYTLRGYAVNQRILAVEERIDNRLMSHERRLEAVEEKIDFFVRTNMLPAEQVFFEGEFFEARVLLEKLIKMAKKRVIIIDGYIDAATFEMLDVRAKGVTADIYSDSEYKTLRDSHNASKGKQPINTHKWFKSSHDRWVIIDDTLYHCGHSVKDLGKKLSAIMKMDWNPEVVLKEVR